MTAVCALALAAATLARSANVGVAAGLAGWVITVLAAQAAAGSLTAALTDSALILPYLAFAACCGVIVLYATRISERNVMNVEITDLTRRFGRTQAVDGVSLQTGPGVFGLLGPERRGQDHAAADDGHRDPADRRARCGCSAAIPAATAPRREIRRRLGYLPQNLGYYPGFTVAEFVEYFALLKEMPPAPGAAGGGGRHRAGRPRRPGAGQAAHPVRRDAAPGRASRRRS